MLALELIELALAEGVPTSHIKNKNDLFRKPAGSTEFRIRLERFNCIPLTNTIDYISPVDFYFIVYNKDKKHSLITVPDDLRGRYTAISPLPSQGYIELSPEIRPSSRIRTSTALDLRFEYKEFVAYDVPNRLLISFPSEDEYGRSQFTGVYGYVERTVPHLVGRVDGRYNPLYRFYCSDIPTTGLHIFFMVYDLNHSLYRTFHSRVSIDKNANDFGRVTPDRDRAEIRFIINQPIVLEYAHVHGFAVCGGNPLGYYECVDRALFSVLFSPNIPVYEMKEVRLSAFTYTISNIKII